MLILSTQPLEQKLTPEAFLKAKKEETKELERQRTIDMIADRIARKQASHPLRVAIDGRTASGKTTLANEIATALRARGRTVIRTSVDGFHRPRAERYRQGRFSAEGYLDQAGSWSVTQAH